MLATESKSLKLGKVGIGDMFNNELTALFSEFILFWRVLSLLIMAEFMLLAIEQACSMEVGGVVLLLGKPEVINDWAAAVFPAGTKFDSVFVATN